jgi:hypothetical protein
MTGSAPWSVRVLGLLAIVGFGSIAVRVGSSVAQGSWLAVSELAALEVTVAAALALAAAGVFGPGGRMLQLDTWPAVIGVRAWLQRAAVLWCMSLAALLGVFPGLALGLGPPAAWPPALLAVVVFAASALGARSPRRIAWLLCTSYGLAAATSLGVVRHVL